MRKFEIVDKKHLVHNKEIQLPTRADPGSAGYDFYSPVDFTLYPNQTLIIPMDVKVCMEPDEVLLLFIRSSVGIKKRIIITNGTGVIDSTYYNNPDNDGNICGAFTNIGQTAQEFKKGDRIMQGVFVKYLTTENDQPLNTQRQGGIGSSGK